MDCEVYKWCNTKNSLEKTIYSMGVSRDGQGWALAPPRNAEQGYFLVTKQWLHTIIHEVAIAGHTNENYLPLRVLDFFCKASFMPYLIINMLKIPFTRLTFWVRCRYFWARHGWFSQCKRCGPLKISYLCLKIYPCLAPLYESEIGSVRFISELSSGRQDRSVTFCSGTDKNLGKTVF